MPKIISANGAVRNLFGASSLDGLWDVTISAVADNEVLAYDSGTSTWINQTPAEANLYSVGGTDVALADGGTGASLADPNADRILFWDDSAGAVTWLTAGTGLSITTTTLSYSGTVYTDESIQDLVGAMFSGNTETGVTVTYQDADGTIDVVVSDLTVAGDSGSTGMTPGDTLTVAGGTGITTSMSLDTLTIAYSGTVYTDESLQDLVGAMFSGNTETGVTVTYQDADGTVDVVVSDTTVAGDTGSTGITPGDTLTIAGGTNATTAMSGDTLTVNVDDAFLLNTGDVGTGVYDFGGATSLEIPNGTNPTTDAAGEIALDTNGDATTVTHGVVKVYDGTTQLYVFPATGYPSSDNDVMAYDSASNSVTWQAQVGTGGGGLSDGDYGDITVSGTGTVMTIDLPTAAVIDAADSVIFKDASASNVTRSETVNDLFTIGLALSGSVEFIQDTVGAMFSGNTETGIAVAYQDSDGTIDLAVGSASDTAAGIIEIAVQSEMEAASSNTLTVTPGRLQYHPGVAKAWAHLDGTGTATLQNSYNVTSITDNGTGEYTFNWTTAFSAADMCVLASGGHAGGVTRHIHYSVDTFATGSSKVVVFRSDTGVNVDVAEITIVGFGDQ